jgi:glycosyltransferase involved in cell wall biosynthesis
MKILYFYPDNPLNLVQGNNARALALLKYFKDRNIQVDFVGEGTKSFTSDDIKKMEEQNLIEKGYLIPTFDKRKHQIAYLFKYSLYNRIVGRIKQFYRVKPGFQEEFDKILSENSYDSIMVSYACWASLVIDNKLTKNARLIVDTHDFLTAQFQKAKHFNLGNFFNAEINLLKKFDDILVISTEEKYLFSQFCKKSKVSIVTYSLPEKQGISENNHKYDIIYVGSANEHNIKAAEWFFNEVYPKLSKQISILVIGKIVDKIPDYESVEKINYIENLDEVYRNAKIAMCPMFSGTGLKIKVVEAMSFGLPIVCNEAGTDGLYNKNRNGCLVTNDSQEFADNIFKLLNDTTFYLKMQSEVKQYFSENHAVENQYQKLDSVFIR